MATNGGKNLVWRFFHRQESEFCTIVWSVWHFHIWMCIDHICECIHQSMKSFLGSVQLSISGNRKCSKFLLQYLGSEQLHLLWAHFVPLPSVICDESFLSIDGIFENLQFDGVPKLEIFILSTKTQGAFMYMYNGVYHILYRSVYLPSPTTRFERCELVKPGLGLFTICIVVQVVLTHMFLSQGATPLVSFHPPNPRKNSRILGPKKICIR